jgi:transcriptional regulator with XRE-family HTH domain
VKKGDRCCIYTKIKLLCKKKGISIRKLEMDLGFSSGSVCKWDSSVPSFERTVKVADYLGITLDKLRAEGIVKKEVV